MPPWLLAGTTAGPLLSTSSDQVTPLPTPSLTTLSYTSLTLPNDKLFHSSIISELLYRYCQRIYPVLGRLYYQRLVNRLDHHLVPKSVICSILAYEATYSDHPVVRRKPGYETCLIYHKRARLAVTENLEGCTMDDMVALVLMGDNEAALGSLEAGDFYFTSAIRLGQQLGLHLADAPGPQNCSIGTDLPGFIPGILRHELDRTLLSTDSHLTLLRETKRIVWWQAYFYQILYSLTFGTPPAVNPDEVCVTLPNQYIKMPELNRLLLNESRDTMGTHRIYPSIYPEYLDIYPWISDEATMLKLQYRVVDLSYKRKFNPQLWLDQLPQINQELDHWLTDLPYTKYPELFSSVGSGQGDGLGGHVIVGLLYLRFAEFYAMRIRINDTSDLPDPTVLDDIVISQCRQRCWHTAMAAQDLLHRSKKLPIPCHNLSITGCLYLTASVCITEFSLEESGTERKRVAYDILQEILDFLQIHSTYYPLNRQLIKDLQDRIAPFL
ncbi:hypothetical protein IWQ62_000494 [Dispira parvispora]|uniref:Xylanolytic transcriptional activator regulatory domain-containing protein n=1 Tax=Dispira parvispora TaxID=1520584 RepID=A0A9W8B027_9FUNG|nr:hypothetical protein IWQ62_000494 [Dispira parvispora]